MAHSATPAAGAAAHKQPTCTNCTYAFLPDEPNEFCPRCGQQNHPVVIGFGHIVEEFLEGVFHFDGKVFRTAGLLLFKPGELTRRYLAGQRMPYVPPLRLYVFLSFVYFLLLSGNTSSEGTNVKFNKGNNISINFSNKKADEVAEVDAPKDKAQAKALADSARANLERTKPDTLRLLQIGKTAVLKMSVADIKRLPTEITAAQVDSIIARQKVPNTYLRRRLIKRVVRWHGASQEEIIHQLLRGFSILLFLLMPLAALLFNLAYFRQRCYYISHLIFTVHLQCFALVLLTLLLVLGWLHVWGGVMLVPLLYGVAYFVLALRRVYAQDWLKTLAKSVLLAFAYSLTIAFALMLVSGVGAAFF